MPKKPKAESATLQTWTIDVIETRSVRVQVKARSQSAAQALASTTAHSDGRWTGSSTKTSVVNHWPASETEEIEHRLPNGYRVRRGWWWEVELHGRFGQYGVTRRKISFTPDLVDPGDYGVTSDSFRKLAGAREDIYNFQKVYGWAATYVDGSTWSKVHQEPKAAYEDCVAFITQQHRDFEQRSLDLRLIAWVAGRGGKMERQKGGLWIVPGADQIGDYSANKKRIDSLIAQGFVEVTGWLTISNQPREIAVTDAGRKEAEEWLQLPEMFR